jgi:hypothetical protein
MCHPYLAAYPLFRHKISVFPSVRFSFSVILRWSPAERNLQYCLSCAPRKLEPGGKPYPASLSRARSLSHGSYSTWCQAIFLSHCSSEQSCSPRISAATPSSSICALSGSYSVYFLVYCEYRKSLGCRVSLKEASAIACTLGMLKDPNHRNLYASPKLPS